MRIIGFNLTKILSERKDKPAQNLKIKSNIEISDVSKDKIEITKQEILKIGFKFSIEYEPDFAKIELAGYLILIPEPDELKKILKSWKSKKVPDDIRIPLFNFIMTKCNIKAIPIEDELNLPLHIPMPSLKPQPKED